MKQTSKMQNDNKKIICYNLEQKSRKFFSKVLIFLQYTQKHIHIHMNTKIILIQ